MRTVNYLSPSSIKLFYDNKQEFYLQYLSPEKPDRPLQTNAMAAGSAFDAYVKAYLHECLFDHDSRFDLDAIFEAQVEPQNRDEAKGVGEYLFEQYKKSGALVDLLTDLEASIGPPRLELAIQGAVINENLELEREGIVSRVGDIVLLGKPDIIYINKEGYHVILDWKVNGYYSNYPPSPAKGYIRLRNPNSKMYVDPKLFETSHPDAMPMQHKGCWINASQYLEGVNKDWASQLSIYGWLSGCSVGEDFLVAIDQLVCNTQNKIRYNSSVLNSSIDYPSIKIAEHRLRISEAFQNKVYLEALHVWDCVKSGHFFKEVSLAESQEKCNMLDEMAKRIKQDKSSTDPKDQWFNSITR